MHMDISDINKVDTDPRTGALSPYSEIRLAFLGVRETCKENSGHLQQHGQQHRVQSSLGKNRWPWRGRVRGKSWGQNWKGGWDGPRLEGETRFGDQTCL